MWPEAAQIIKRWLTGAILCVGAGAVTLHLARWFGTDDPVALAVVVILAELFLGACVLLGLLITTRMSETLMTDPVHDVTPSPAPAVWSPPVAAEQTPADRRMQMYLRRVMQECRSSGAAGSTARRSKNTITARSA